jgi:D-citramalate synthase
MNLAGAHICLMDTTLRDGEQTQGVSFTPSEKVNIAKALLQRVRVDRIEIASARISAGEQEAVRNVTDWAFEHGFLEQVEVLGFCDHKRSVDWIVRAGGKVLNLLTKGSKNHCWNQLGKTLPEHLADVEQTVAYAKASGLRVNAYLEDWSNGYRDSPDYVYEMMAGLEPLGIEHIMLPDTLGVLSPADVFDSMTDMLTRFSWATLDFHPHNDYGLGTANCLYAVKAGIRHLHCTMNCLGERAGNASLAEIAVVLRDKTGATLNIDESSLVPISEMIESFSGKRLAANAPIVGTDVFTQTSGIHADGDKKGGLYHNPIKPERFGRTRSYALGKMSGKASLVKNLEQLGLQLSDENLRKVLDRIVALGDSKKTITPADLPFIVTDVLENNVQQSLRLVGCSVSSGLHLKSTASIAVEWEGKEYTETGSGNGGYDAFMNALKKVLKRRQVQCPELVDYEVRIPRSGQTDALTEAVITWKMGERNMQTIGVDGDQVMAAVNATLKMLNLLLLQSETAAESAA